MNKPLNKPAIVSVKEDDSFFNFIKSSCKKEFDKSSTEKQEILKTKKNEANQSLTNNGTSPKVLSINPYLAINWAYPDRPDNELGDLDSLAISMKENGQIEPCIVRKIEQSKKTNGIDYEIIVGERRWRASKLANIKLDVIIKDLTDEQAAIIQAAENLNRQDLSDYARGMSYATLIKKSLLKQTDLQKRFNISKVQANRLMSFSQIPPEVISAINNMKNVSARLATEIRALCNKGYTQEIILLAGKISDGKLGASNIAHKVKSLRTPNKQTKLESETIKNSKGKTICKVVTNTTGTKLTIDTNSSLINLNELKPKLIELLESIHMDT